MTLIRWSILAALLLWGTAACDAATEKASSEQVVAEHSPNEPLTPSSLRPGYSVLHVGNGNSLSVSDESLRRAFNQECENRRYPKQCDIFESYYWDVRLDDWINVTFAHRDREQSTYVVAFVCTNAAPGWECIAEQE